MYQQITIAGNVGADAEQRFTKEGTAVTSFRMATNRKYTNSAGDHVEETAWFRVTTWAKLAEICAKYVHKGDPVLVIGTLVPDDKGNPKVWVTSDGTPRANFEVRADRVVFLGKPPAQGLGAAGNTEDIPF